jgi:hypothetical protein
LQVAGAYGLTLLYGLLPPLMAWQLRHQQQEQQQQARHSHGAAASGPPAATSIASAQTPGGAKPLAQTGSAEDVSGESSPLVPGGFPVLAGMLAVVGAMTAGRVSADLGLPLDWVVAQLQQMAGNAPGLN